MQSNPALRAVDDDLPLEVRPAEEPRPAPAWSPVKRLLFRFAFAYLILYSFPFPLYYIPYVGMVGMWTFQMWGKLVPWVGQQVFGVAITVFPNGSGDTTYNYVQVFCYLVISAAATLVWSLLDRRRRNYARLYEWLRVYVRFVLAVAMIGYGAFKVIPSQFPAPAFDRLMQPYGDSSPMGLLWTFMGASVAYNVFTGLGELTGGLLLAFRRTTLLGALVCIGVMTNVVMLNFSYDVPVKLYSSHLLLMAVFLAAHDLRRLANVLVLNRPAEPTDPADYRPLFRRRWLHVGTKVLGVLFIGYLTFTSLQFSYKQAKEYSAAESAKSPLYGLWEIEELVVDGKASPPLVTDANRWRRAMFTGGNRMSFQLMSGSRDRFNVDIDPRKRTLAFTKRDDPSWKSTLAYNRPQPKLLVMQGAFDGHKVRARLRKGEIPKSLLMTRGFHWINERPFNR
ncbi:MAG TPA: hypothetical protein VNM67_19135 [Thermoanaerobaculia bacterium]|jgi:uncharacterized membrane protein YphA (DoxX/SURF4 family)|nr:hypothetical protein [Thermoanaerobaculia bacterium]